MTCFPLILLAALAIEPTDGPDPAMLVAKLGSTDPGERTSAADALKTLGRDALPALIRAMKAEDAGLREQASALWEAIERDRMTRPSLVRLDGQLRSREDTLADLESKTGLSLHLDQSSRGDRIGANAAEPIPFRDAIERLGFRGVYQHNPGAGKFARLDLDNNPVWTFTAVDGPFRLALKGLHLHRDRQLIAAPWVRVDRFGQRINVSGEQSPDEVVTYYGGLEVMVEPRMWFTQEEPAKLIEAVDDLGQSLVPEGAGSEVRFSDRAHFAFYGGDGVNSLRTEFRLKATDRPGRVARLRGEVPLMLHLRRPEPTLNIPLAQAAGKTFRTNDGELEIQSVNDSPTSTTVTLIARLDVKNADLPDRADPELITSRLRVMGRHQLELVDAQGKVVADSISSGGGGGNVTPNVYRWTINSHQNGRATNLRYYQMLRVRSRANFAFDNVPLP